MKKMIIASTSTMYGEAYLEYLLPELQVFLNGKTSILFIPFARPGGISEDDYTEKVREAFSKINITVEGLHQFGDKTDAIRKARAIFTGGGNTFLLLHQLYTFNLIPVLAETIKAGTIYIGTSAGSNIAGQTIQTTNDMPIIYPPSYDALGLLPFNLNPHYLDAAAGSHMGETRETRINEYHHLNNTPVVGLREGSWLQVTGNDIILKGGLTARIFQRGEMAIEAASGTNLNYLK